MAVFTPQDINLPAKFTQFRTWQADALNQIVNNSDKSFTILQGPPGCHRIGQEVLMYDGTVKKVEDIQMGELLMGIDGLPRTVLFLFRGQGPMFEIRPIKGQSFVVNSDHILTLQYTQKRPAIVHKKRRADYKGGTIIDISVTNYLSLSNTQKHWLKLFRVPINFSNSSTSLPLDPYFLGLLLGDGSLTQRNVAITTTDEKIREAFTTEATRHKLSVRSYKITYSAIGTRGHKNYILDSLRQLGLNPISSAKRFVPQVYKTATHSDRLSILAGLIDTDGFNGGKSCFGFVSKSKQLATDVAFLARSIGLATYVHRLKPSPRHFPKFSDKIYRRSYWKVSISGNCSIIPTRVKQQSPRKQKKSVLRTGLSIIPTGTIEMFYGFALDGDGRYLLGDFTVTHNSGKTLIAAALQRLLKTRMLFSCTTKQLQDQFCDDFSVDLSGKRWAVELKGRSNYPTQRFRHKFPQINASLCTKKRESHCRWCCDGHCNPDLSGPCLAKFSCPYERQKSLALSSQIAVVNVALFLAEANFVGKFSNWPLVVMDECDTLESELLGFIQLEITKKWIDRLQIDLPRHKTVQESWSEWARDTALPAVTREIDKLASEYGIEDVYRAQQLERMEDKLQFFLKEVANKEKRWVFEPREESWTFKPVYVSDYAHDNIWKHSQRWLLMSGTIISVDEISRTLGIPRSDICFVDMPSSFAASRRPVYYMPVANITNKTKANEFGKIITAVDNILEKFKDKKVLIHTVSYSNANAIVDGSKHSSRMLTYSSAMNRELTLDKFKAAANGAVLVASSMNRGIDLKQDFCRVIILTKVPYMNLGSKQVSARLYSDKKYGNLWYAVAAIRSIIQMCGRGMRSSDDWVICYILDEQFARLYEKYKHLFPQWWKDSLHFVK